MVGSVPQSTDKETEAWELGSLFKVTWEVGDRAASSLPHSAKAELFSN